MHRKEPLRYSSSSSSSGLRGPGRASSGMSFAHRFDAMTSLAELDTVNGGRAPGPPGNLQVGTTVDFHSPPTTSTLSPMPPSK